MKYNKVKQGNARKNETLRRVGVTTGATGNKSKSTAILVQALRVPGGLRLSDFMTIGT